MIPVLQECFKIRTANIICISKSEYFTFTDNVYAVAQSKNHCKSSCRVWSLWRC